MKMKEIKKIGLIGAAGFFASLSLFGGIGASAADDWTSPPADGSAATSSDVPTNLWCAWYVNGMDADVNLYPIEGLTKERIEAEGTIAITDEAIQEYNGEALVLTGYSLDTEALVAGYELGATPRVSDRKDTDGIAISPDPYDCSWYNSELGFTSTVSVDTAGNSNFVATYSGTPDDGMDFGLTGPADAIAITFMQDPVDNCDADFTLASNATIETVADTIGVASVPYSSLLSTSLTCMWDTQFVVTMPAGLMPAAPGADYSFTGPTLKTTMTLDVS